MEMAHDFRASMGVWFNAERSAGRGSGWGRLFRRESEALRLKLAAARQRREVVGAGLDVAHPRLVAAHRDYFEMREEVRPGSHKVSGRDVFVLTAVEVDREYVSVAREEHGAPFGYLPVEAEPRILFGPTPLAAPSCRHHRK